jgi:hypothetical protein
MDSMITECEEEASFPEAFVKKNIRLVPAYLAEGFKTMSC